MCAAALAGKLLLLLPNTNAPGGRVLLLGLPRRQVAGSDCAGSSGGGAKRDISGARRLEQDGAALETRGLDCCCAVLAAAA
jgi:hypothetical protein